MKNPEETRSHIIETAAPIFNKHGYIGATISDVLEHTNLTKGAIYHHFENKDELALAALEYNLRIVSVHIFSKIHITEHSCDQLTSFVEAFRKSYDLMIQMGGCPVVNAAVDSDDVNEMIRERVCRFINMWRESIIRIIEQGKSKKEIRADVNTEKFSLNFISAIEGSLAMSKVSGDRKFLDNAVDLVESLIEGLRV